MKSTLLFDFNVNKENNTINIVREFDADLGLVRKAWTTAELLDKWWAPKPWFTETNIMDFSEGGFWHYVMVGPNGERHWGKATYLTIKEGKSFVANDGFCDEKGVLNPDFPQNLWENNFVQKENKTEVNVLLTFDNLIDLEKTIQMGFKEGFTNALENLDQYIEAQFKFRRENKVDNQSRVCTYLNFDGKTEEAFLFYKKVFGTQFSGKGIQRFGDIPTGDAHDAVKKMVLHVELPITGNHILMGTDAPKEMGFTIMKGNNMYICIQPESKEEADRLFNGLSIGGNVTMPMKDMFFGAYFGEFSDKFGINWMINFQNNDQ